MGVQGHFNLRPGGGGGGGGLTAAQVEALVKGVPIYRNNATEDTAPSAAEYPNVTDGDVGVVYLNNGLQEVWERVAGAWVKQQRIDASGGPQSKTETINRANTTEDVAPTGGEFATPNTDSRALVNLNGEILELWTFASGAWVKDSSFQGGGGDTFLINEVVTAAATITNAELAASDNTYGIAASGGPYNIAVDPGAADGSEIYLKNVGTGDIGFTFSGGESFSGDTNPIANGAGTIAFKKASATQWDLIDANQSGGGGGGGAVDSVFTRTGDVVAANGDYTASQVTNVPSGNLAANTVQGALDELQTEIDGIPAAPITTVHGRTGAVVADNGDYTASQITNVPANGLAATTAQGAIDELKLELVKRFGHVFCPEDFGATGDAVADDTVAVQAALDAAEAYAVANGSAAFWGSQNYRITDEVVLQNWASGHVHIEFLPGAGISADNGGANNRSLRVAGAGTTAQVPTDITGPVARGQRVIPVTSVANLVNGGFVKIDQTSPDGVPWAQTSKVTDITGLNVTIEDVLRFPIDETAATSTVTNNVLQAGFSMNGGDIVLHPGQAATNRIGFSPQALYKPKISNVNVSGFNTSISQGLNASNNLGATFENILVEDCGEGAAEAINLEAHASVINNMRALNSLGFGISMDQCTGCKIYALEGSNAASRTIKLAGCCGNQFYSTTANFGASSNLSVSESSCWNDFYGGECNGSTGTGSSAGIWCNGVGNNYNAFYDFNCLGNVNTTPDNRDVFVANGDIGNNFVRLNDDAQVQILDTVKSTIITTKIPQIAKGEVTGGFTIPGTGASTTIIFNASDANNNRHGNLDLTTGVWTCKMPNWYRVISRLSIFPITATAVFIDMMLNGGAISRMRESNVTTFTLDEVLWVDQGDTVHIRAIQASGSDVTLNAGANYSQITFTPMG